MSIETTTDFEAVVDYLLAQNEERSWFYFLKTAGQDDLESATLHDAARYAIIYHDTVKAQAESSEELVRALLRLYRHKGWEIHEDSLSGIQAEVLTEQLMSRHDLGEFFRDYAFDHASDPSPVAFANEAFVTAWTEEILRREKGDAA